MKLLVVLPSLPSPTWGLGIRNYYLLKALAHKHMVSLLALSDSTEVGADEYMPPLEHLLCTAQVIVRPMPRAKRLQQVLSAVRGRSYMLSMHSLPELQEALD